MTTARRYLGHAVQAPCAIGVLAVGVSAAAVVFAVGLAHWYSGAAGADYRGASSYISRTAKAGDGVLFYAPYVRMPFELYFRETRRSHEVRPVIPPTVEPGARTLHPVRPDATVGDLNGVGAISPDLAGSGPIPALRPG